MYSPIILRALKLTLLAIFSLAIPALAEEPSAPTVTSLTVLANHPGPKINPRLYGIFFEELDFAGDGGLYAQLVNNGSFENNATNAENWSLVTANDAIGSMALENSNLLNAAQSHCLRINVDKLTSGGRVAVANDGYWGINVIKDQPYQLTFFARCADGASSIRATLEDAQHKLVYASAVVKGLSGEWKQFTVNLRADGTDHDGRLVLAPTSTGTVWLDVVTLFPPTFKNQPNGLRPDLAKLLVDFNPGFMRFPGGCYVQGYDSIDQAFDWKKSIGPLQDRRGMKIMWGYYATQGFGYLEMLEFAEDLGAEPIFVVNCGQTMKGSVPDAEIPQFVESALDAIEYANGPVTSKWGAERAKDGHPAPFHLRIIAIGNEDAVPDMQADYKKHYAIFRKAIHARYPEIEFIQSENQLTDDPQWNGQPANFVDQHFYRSPGWFFDHNNKYDDYPRKDPKVFLSELASLSPDIGEGNLWGAIGEAAFMTGLERNADVVAFTCYAPLFRNVNWRNWNPNMIVFNNHQAYGIPSYYLWKMFMHNTGDVYIPSALVGNTVTNIISLKGRVGVSTYQTEAEFRDIHVTQAGEPDLLADFSNGTQGWQTGNGQWSVVDGAYRQSGLDRDCESLFVPVKADSYVYTLEARKISGKEAFQVVFADNQNGKFVWNLGGWGNTRSSLMRVVNGELTEVGDKTPENLESNRWYKVRIEVNQHRIKCYLDGQLREDYLVPPETSRSLFVSVNRDTPKGELILKVVNASENVQPTAIHLQGVQHVADSGKVIVLTSANRSDENSFNDPHKVVPVTCDLTGLGRDFTYDFLPHAITLIRVKAH